MGPEKELAELEKERAALLEKSATDDFTTEDAARAETVVTRMGELKALIEKRQEISRKLASIAGEPREVSDASDLVTGSIGERFVKSDAMKGFRGAYPKGVESKHNPIDIAAKQIGSKRLALKADPPPLNTGNGDFAPTRLPGIEDVTYRKPQTLLDLIFQGPTNSPWLEYRQLVSITNNAAIVPEGELKPLSTLTTRTADAKSHTYADGIEITNQELADDGALVALIDGILTDNLRTEVERIILEGGGTADEPAGIMNTTGVLQQDHVTDMVVTLRKAKTLLSTTSHTISQAVVLNPEDDEEFDLLKDTTGRYLGNGPFGTGPSSIWAIPRVTTPLIPVGTALMGDFRGVQLLIYEALSILAFNQHKDYAQRNLTYLRAELRALQMIRQPAKLLIADIGG